jgi:two-component system nitrogen regulation response regulator NtrX
MPLRILIVDDEPNICSTLQGLLEDLGHSARSCSSGEAALELLGQESFDLVFLDVRLPGIDGLATLEQIAERQLEVAVMMISAHADVEMAIRATRLGAFNFLEKPLLPQKVSLEIANFAERQRLEYEMRMLRSRVGAAPELIGESLTMQKLRADLRRAAASDSRVLIYGENGTGKELVAAALHQNSARREKPFVKVNCAAIPRELIESELFGHERGAFTGAARRKIGLIEEADGGSIFLDEVGDMALETQAKLLRVLQENELTRVGGTQPIRFDVRVIAATNKNLQEEIRAGRFREDLFFRLNVIPITVPPLRERSGDVRVLATHFLAEIGGEQGRRPKTLSADAASLLEEHYWPGNVRELRNIIERLMIMNDEAVVMPKHVRSALPGLSAKMDDQLPAPAASATDGALSLRDRVEHFEKRLLENTFRDAKGNVSEMARLLRTDRANLHRKLQRYRIK